MSTFESPYTFPTTTPLADSASMLGRDVTVSGRVRRRRDQGGVVFIDLQDQTGYLQIIATADEPESCRELADARIGDWLGIEGEVIETRRGTRSVRAEQVTTLAQSLRPFPNHWQGIADPDTRWRQRYADLWVTDGAHQMLRARSAIVRTLRDLLHTQGFMEVETPLLNHQAGGANARPFTTHHNALDVDLQLRVAPELFLKRLVVGGFERVFEIGRAFRNEGMSRRHNPEFTILEVYQAFADVYTMMDLTEELIVACCHELHSDLTISWGDVPLDLTRPWTRITMHDAVLDIAGIDIDVSGPADHALRSAVTVDVDCDPAWTAGRVLAEVFDRVVDPQLEGPVFVTDYPTEVSPLARPHRERPGVTERFELFVAGREIANAFSELTDPAVQRSRFEDQVRAAERGDDEAMPFDQDYIRALEYGLPPTGGLGIGVDRLVMMLTGTDNIREVIAFPTLRPEAVDHPGDKAI